MDTSTIATIIFLLTGISFLIFGSLLYRNFKKIKDEGKKTRAKVVDLIEEKTNNGKTYRQIVEFTTTRGKSVTQQLDYSSSFKPKQQIPFPMDIFYLEENGKIKIMPANSKLPFIMSFIFIAIGIICIGVLVFEITGQTHIFTGK